MANRKTTSAPIDKESQKLLDEIDAAAKVDADAAAKVDADAAGNTLTNNGINFRRINGVEIGAGDTYELSEDELSDESLMAKVNRAVKLGVLARS